MINYRTKKYLEKILSYGEKNYMQETEKEILITNIYVLVSIKKEFITNEIKSILVSKFGDFKGKHNAKINNLLNFDLEKSKNRYDESSNCNKLINTGLCKWSRWDEKNLAIFWNQKEAKYHYFEVQLLPDHYNYNLNNENCINNGLLHFEYYEMTCYVVNHRYDNFKYLNMNVSDRDEK